MCGRRADILCAYFWGILLSLLPCWLLYRAGIEDAGGPYPGETLATGASVLWGRRWYLKSTTLLLEGEQLCCFGLVGTESALSRLLSLQIWVWASTDLCSSEHL